MKSLTPIQSLALLILVGVAISGWLYGIHWKRVASGDLFSSEERLMIRLQDQIRSLTETNANLTEQIKTHSLASDEAGEGTPPQPPAPVDVLPEVPSPQGLPVLPSRPQKIETH